MSARAIVPKLAALAVTALLTLALAACGSGSSTSTTGPSAAATASTQKEATTAAAAGKGKKAGSAGKEGKSSASREKEEASKFVPKQHSDSGGGSKQFIQKGGDNSVQEFGGEAGTSELDRAATALHNFLDARAAGNWAATCSYMSKSTVESLEKLAAQSKQIEDKGCGGVLEKLTNPAAKQELREEAAQADVGSLRIEGGRAFIIYRGIDKAVIAIPMTKEGGSWKVAGLSGTPLN